jgi:hypothetical protein
VFRVTVPELTHPDVDIGIVQAPVLLLIVTAFPTEPA